MPNSTSLPIYVLILGYGEFTNINYLYTMIALVGFLMSILSNCTIIFTILLTESLKKPMYIFISALCTNGVCVSMTFFPDLSINLISKTPTISYMACIIQVFCMHTCAVCEVTTLAVMAYDRYVCICNPLRYTSIMTLTTACKLISAVWIFAITLIAIHVVLTARLPLCDNVILKIYCDNWAVVRLSCVDTTLNNIYGIFITVIAFVVMPLIIIFSYTEILKVCVKSKVAKDKAMQTCTPQLMSILIFITGCAFEIIVQRILTSRIPNGLRVFVSVEVTVLPPLVNPILYGLKMTAIKVRIGKILSNDKIHQPLIDV